MPETLDRGAGDRPVSKAPDRCLYCKGDDPNCGFCEMGVPLDTQQDWDRSWGRVERPISDDHHDSDRSTDPDSIVAERDL